MTKRIAIALCAVLWAAFAYAQQNGSGQGQQSSAGLTFPVEFYGASPSVGAYHTYGDGSITGNTFSSANATFTPADVGSPIWIFYAGATTTISPPATPTQV